MIAYPFNAPSPLASSGQMVYLSAVQRHHREGEGYRLAVNEDNLPLHMRRKAFSAAVMFELLTPLGYDARRDIFWDVYHRDFVNGCSLDAIAIMDSMTIDSAIGYRRPLSRTDAETYAQQIVDRWWPTAIETIVYYNRHKITPRACDIYQSRHGGGCVDYWYLSDESKDVYRAVAAGRQPASALLAIDEAPTTAQRAEIIDRSVIYYA